MDVRVGSVAVRLPPVLPARLSAAQRVDTLEGLARLRAWADAQEQHLLAAMAAPGDPPRSLKDPVAVGKQFVREEIGCVLRVAPVTVNARLHLAGELVRRLPDTLGELERGVIGLPYARCLVEAVGALPDDAAAVVERRVLPGAGRQTLRGFRDSVARAVLALDPRSAEQAHSDALARRRVQARVLEHGMGSLYAELPAEAVQAIMTRVQQAADTLAQTDRAAAAAAASTGPSGAASTGAAVGAGGGAAAGAAADAGGGGGGGGGVRTADQLRADALVALVTGQPLDLRATWQGRRPTVNVSVALSTLLHLDDQPGELDGHGPVPAVLARRIAADPTGTWRRLVTDPLGGVIDVGRDAYEPPQDLSEHVLARDRICRFPGCRRRARRCEIDHQLAWQDGGRTDACNLQCLCPRHHHLKHEAEGWSVHGNPDGDLLWTTPTGHTYLDPPGQHPTDTTTTTGLDPGDPNGNGDPNGTDDCPF